MTMLNAAAPTTWEVPATYVNTYNSATYPDPGIYTATVLCDCGTLTASKSATLFVGNVQISGELNGVATNFDASTVTTCVSNCVGLVATIEPNLGKHANNFHWTYPGRAFQANPDDNDIQYCNSHQGRSFLDPSLMYLRPTSVVVSAAVNFPSRDSFHAGDHCAYPCRVTCTPKRKDAGGNWVDDSFTLNVANILYRKSADCAGFDETLDPPWLMVPKNGDNTASVLIEPSSLVSQTGFESADTSKATVSPSTASTSPQVITVSGILEGSTEIRTKVSGAVLTCSKLKLAVKKRINKTIAIHAITEENDDVQVIPVGHGQPNQICVSAGTNGVLSTTTAGDDVIVGSSINTGADGICQSTASSNDVQVIVVGKGKAGAICVGKGSNSFRDTATVGGDDVVVGDDITTGPDGICDTTAYHTNLVPGNVPSVSALENYLNDVIGKQANVFFTVTSSDYTVNYDLDRNGMLADEFWVSATAAEDNAIRAVARDTSVDYNIYYVNAHEAPVGITIGAEVFSQGTAAGAADMYNHTAHEVVHLLGRSGHSGDILDLMYDRSVPQRGCRLRMVEWGTINP